MNVKEILKLICDLPVEQRIKIAEAVQESLNKLEPEVEQAWAEEAERRLDEIENGEIETIPGPQAMNKLKKIAKA